MSTVPGPLYGLRVLELGSLIAGPFGGQLLGDYGAEVIKIEAPAGDPLRRWGALHDGESLWWTAIARNKRSVVVDLNTEAGAGVVRRLALSADIVVQNFHPGQLERWGLGYEGLAVENPGLIMVHISGYGRSGPRAAEAGFGSIGEAMGGIRHTTGPADGPSCRAGISLGDSLAAMFAVIGALAAVHERATSGKGQEVDVALYEAVAALMESSLADAEVSGVVRGRSGGVLPGVAPSNAYPTADGAEVLIAANADGVFARLCVAMDQPQLADDPRFATHQARGDNAGELDRLIATWTSRCASDDVLAVMATHRVPSGRVYTATDALEDEHYKARHMVVRMLSGNGQLVPMPGVVPRFSRTPGSIRSAGPALGADTDAVLGSLAGLGGEQIDELRADQVIR
ncbi:MAG: CoA transferase [Acidimicrobiales bacterium]|jgi:formyl-CoA transferase/succinyl-CoA--D-citramalate CoA-transferase